jgi:hypothetical protein
MEDDLVQQVRLNLRISCTNGEGETPVTHTMNQHVSKVQIQNFPASGLGGDSMSMLDEQLKRSLSSLHIEGYVQPLFKVEKLNRT